MRPSVIVPVILYLFVSCEPALGQPPALFTLKDGTQIHGNLSAVDGGQYVIQTTSAGIIKVPKNEVVSMTTLSIGSGTPQKGAANPGSKFDSGQVEGLQHKLMADSQMMSDIAELSANKEVMSLISDPSLLSALKSNDIDALETNPKLKQLMENPKIRRLLEQITANELK